MACLKSICTVFDIVKRNGVFLPPSEATSILEEYERFLVHYDWLAQFSLDSDRLLYHVVTKTHMFWHICYHAKYLNPKCTWCFEFEDFVGTMIACAKGCMAGSPLVIVGRQIIDHYILVLHLRLSR